ncbi:glutathione S-transferase [Nitratireductor indicus]|uniref:Glutathione S-transferase domain-containing protein n=1 Tax=Nitratireductor indicus C115 TaxID=1231190 RepID=K2P204_9HYPH|nr:glutathione S-transferase [Nitratireductor indicus]EKF41416.1 glutathione S-transferase domain-containing protein [Nitratireductor indicus C115]MDS1138429.1 glutathione S-transferase [Nitratireductor indicus]SFQ72041.1 Glutathione S-transferase [Nitratireductor indicus]
MKLFHSPTSPYVRKVMVTAIEKGVEPRIERLKAAANPINRDRSIVAQNPSGKVPTLILDDGRVLFDSRVICAYLDAHGEGPSLMPEGEKRFDVMTLEALADSILDAALLIRYERLVRPPELFSAGWHDGQMEKIDSALDALAQRWLPLLGEPIHAGSVAVGCALGYLDFRQPGKDWRSTHPKLSGWFAGFSRRPSMIATVPQG